MHNTHIQLIFKTNGLTNGICGSGVSLYARYIILCSSNIVATCVRVSIRLETVKLDWITHNYTYTTYLFCMFIYN
jgi:ABC-type lipoprotein release transport system permease subunit